MKIHGSSIPLRTKSSYSYPTMTIVDIRHDSNEMRNEPKNKIRCLANLKSFLFIPVCHVIAILIRKP